MAALFGFLSLVLMYFLVVLFFSIFGRLTNTSFKYKSSPAIKPIHTISEIKEIRKFDKKKQLLDALDYYENIMPRSSSFNRYDYFGWEEKYKKNNLRASIIISNKDEDFVIKCYDKFIYRKINLIDYKTSIYSVLKKFEN